MKPVKLVGSILAFLLAAALLPGVALAAETYMLAFGSDRHGATTAIGDAMGSMPKAVEYVGVLGDMVGGGSDPVNPQPSSSSGEAAQSFINGAHAPAFDSSTVYDEVLGVGFDNVTSNEDVDILWADHDAGVTDDAGIVFANGGYGSGVMYEGPTDADGTPAYYVYGIAFYEMVNARDEKGNAETQAMKDAAHEFENWVDGIDRSVPIIVCSHVPLHYARGDNVGAVAWNNALNYAATGIENPEAGCAVSRNVVFLFGHNHTTESKKDKTTGEITYSGEFFVPSGSQMEIGTESDVWSPIYYNYTTAGYLNQNTSATLIAIEDGEIAFSKYRNGEVVDGLYDSAGRKSGAFASAFVTAGENEVARVQRIASDLPEGCSITYTDASGGSRTLRGSGEAYHQMGEITGKVSFDSERYTVDSLTVTQDGSAVDVAKVGSCTFTFTLSKSSSDVAVTVTQKDRIAIADAQVSGVKAAYTYSGKAIKPTPKVSLGDGVLKAGEDYKVSYAKNTNAGTATLTVTGLGDYMGKAERTFKIDKAKNPLVAKGKTVKVKAAKVKKKAQTFSRANAMKVSKAQGKVTYKKVKGNGKIKVNKKTGKLTVGKGLKKGTYKVKVKVTAAGNKNYQKLTRTVTVTVKVV